MTYTDFEIEIPRGRTTGQIYTKCPKCSHDRKKKNIKCLGVNLDQSIWHCNHCGWKGSLQKKRFDRPKWENKTDLPDTVVEWFQQRNIRQDTLAEMKITTASAFMPQVSENRKCICFNYFRGGELINVKYRDRDKNFTMHKNAELILYNLDAIWGQEEIFIVEGEPDCLVMVQSGIKNTCSVPNGAIKPPKDLTEARQVNNLQYIDNCYEAFQNAKRIYIMTDSDDPGNLLADELGRRLGAERCFHLRIEGYKDVNDALNDGNIITKDWLLTFAEPFPVAGVFKAEQYWENLLFIRKNGFPKGWKPRLLGEYVTVHPGYTSMSTGIPTHGKSEVLDQIVLEISLDYNLKGGFFSPENKPAAIHLMKIIEKIAGRSFWSMSIEEIDYCKAWINEHIYWVNPVDGYTLEDILELVRKAILMHGLHWYVIDPWNKIDHQFQGPETRYISECLDKIDNFNARNNVHGFVVAHPGKMEKDKSTGKFEIPNLYKISGSAHFFNKADLGWTVYKVAEGQTDIHIQKVKFKYWGHTGLLNLLYDKDSGRYYTVNKDTSHWLVPATQVKQEEMFATPLPPTEVVDDLPF